MRAGLWVPVGFAAGGLFLMIGCADPRSEQDTDSETRAATEVQAVLTEIASSERQWTGLTVSPDGRLFVNFPRWSDDVPISVAEMVEGAPVPFPDERWNAWTPGDDPANAFVCVQSVVADDEGYLWVLDPARVGGLAEGGVKLIRFDTGSGEPVAVYRYSAPVITERSYLNDVRIDLEAGYAYITDSGDGAIVLTDLSSGESRRLLAGQPSTAAEDVILTIEGRPWVRGDGTAPQVHADGIALSPDREYLYFQALTGRTLYRVPTASLRDLELGAEDLAARVEVVGKTGAADGLIFGTDGNLYISALEESAIRRLDPGTGTAEVVVADPRIRWPDTFTRDTEGRILFTTAQIHLGSSATEPYRIFRIDAR